MNRDPEFIKTIIEEFSSCSMVRKRMRSFFEADCNNWECWLQSEMYCFLSQHERVAEVCPECSYSIDKRINNEKLVGRVDFAIRQKWAKKESYILIELKVNRNREDCLREMIADSAKIKALKRSEFDGRSVFYIGLFYDRDRHRNNDHAKWAVQYLESRSQSLKVIYFVKIGRTGVNLVVLE